MITTSAVNHEGFHQPLEVIVEAGRKLTSSLVCDRLYGHGFPLPPILTNLTPAIRLAGPAFPVSVDQSILPILQALDECPAHHLLVIHDRRGGAAAVVGDIILTATRMARIGGIVCFGAVRDVEAAPEIGIPVWASHVRPNASPLGPAVASFPEEVVVEGRAIRKGDWLFGDRDGIVCVEREHIRLVMKAAQLKARRERAFLKRMAAGERLTETMNLKAHLLHGENLIIGF